jgi:hypothetical protein
MVLGPVPLRRSVEGTPPLGLFWALIAGAFMASVVTAGSCVTSDEFECGLPLETDEAQAKICDQSSETCICKINRCAVNDPSCTETGLRYSFGNRECVDIEAAATAHAQTTGSSKFCPGAGQPAPCGVTDGAACRADEVCACAQKRCATFDPVACPSTYRYAGSDDCVEPIDARPEVLLFPGETGTNALCPSESMPPLPCGVSQPDSPLVICGEKETCICAKAIFQCAIRSPGCASEYAYFDGSCVRELTATEIEASENQVNSEGVCPQYAAKDAGKD